LVVYLELTWSAPVLPLLSAFPFLSATMKFPELSTAGQAQQAPWGALGLKYNPEAMSRNGCEGVLLSVMGLFGYMVETFGVGQPRYLSIVAGAVWFADVVQAFEAVTGWPVRRG
jgi:hypothetical protein